MTDSLGKEGPSKQSKTLHTQMEEEEGRPACAAWARPKLVATIKTSRNLVALDILHGFPRMRPACGEEAPAEDPMAKLTPQELLAHQEVEQALQQGFSHAEEGLFTLSPLALRSLEQALQQDEAEKELQEKHHAEDVWANV